MSVRGLRFCRWRLRNTIRDWPEGDHFRAGSDDAWHRASMSDAAVRRDAVHSCLGRYHDTVDAGFLASGGEASIVVTLGGNVELGLLRSSQLDHVLDLVLVLDSEGANRNQYEMHRLARMRIYSNTYIFK